MDPETMKISNIIDVLEKQPEEQGELKAVHKKLKDTVYELKRLNDLNRMLMEQSLEMIAFDLNVLQSMKGMPLVNNYNKKARQQFDNEPYNSSKGVFDAKR